MVSYGCAILLRDWLDANTLTVGHAPLVFWMAQQGASAGMLCVISFTIGYIIYFQFLGGTKDQLLLGITPEGIGFVGMLINCAVSFNVSAFTPSPLQEAQVMVDQIHILKGAGEASNL
ncbi:MAG: sodium/substrate symporter small subunit [Verrucomicrobiota bacterium]